MALTSSTTTHFDLNIEKVLEHWPLAYAVREIIANALDEQAITATPDPVIRKISDRLWEIADFGRGLRYQHLTQKENVEKLRHPGVIGQFGMGLKDALAVFHRRRVDVLIRSPHMDMTTALRPKDGFTDITTLHAAVTAPSQPGRTGTSIVLRGISDEEIEQATQYFLRYNRERPLEETHYGQVLARPAGQVGAHIYVKGLLVAREENFLFSYNITTLTKGLRQALNRERSNVGRTAYTDRVKAILKQCRTAEVARGLADDLAAFTTGRMHDELGWNDIAQHACRVLASHEKVVFVSRTDLEFGAAQLDYARADGFRLVLVPDDIAGRIGSLTDFDGASLYDLDGYRDIWNDSFTFRFVDPSHLHYTERQVYALTEPLLAALGIIPERIGVRAIMISETMRLNSAGNEVVGMYESAAKRIVIRRDQLAAPADYCGTLLHELTHASSGTVDGTLAFEGALTDQLGSLAVVLLRADRR
ncbi:hypothetical protein [Nocardia sp. NPDC057227]|uniref:hypothetical protein n=1 Tax=Nocardia sp. NPDC057227 TaxID=3346056 RepID=UPI003642A80A